MDKQQEAQADSISSVGVTVKEYPPSEVYSSEPPPAYQKPRATAVQIARIAAATVISVSFILGFFMLGSAYITATYSCSHLVHQEQLQQEVDDQPQYQHLVDPLQPEESSESKHESLVPPPPPQGAQQEPPSPIQIKLPLQLDFDEIAGSLMERNQRSRMNCVVEKRRAEEVMDHQPKTVQLPFGVNVTTDPRYEHVTGERMAIFCESGHDQRHVPMESMATPVVVPIHQPVPVAVPVPVGPHGPQPFHHPPPQMMHHNNLQQPPHIIRMQHNMPPPPMMQHAQPLPHPAQTQAQMNQIPLSILTRIAQEEAASDKDDAPIHIIAREEHIVPVLNPAEGRAINSAPEPSDMIRPPPMTFQTFPVHIHQQPPAHVMQENMPPPHVMHQNMPQPEAIRPHYVHPRSVRSVDNLLHRREKRVRRCACDCSC